MARVKLSVHSRKQRRAVLDRARGFRGARSRRYRVANANEALIVAGSRGAKVRDEKGEVAVASERADKGIKVVVGGGAFVLFTSYGALGRAHAALARGLQAHGIEVLRQGEADRHRLLERFRASRSAALFATDSFWEGVDVRGDTLRLVVIARLPFRVPTEPIQQARMEAIEARGGNPFTEYGLTQAVIKLRQGFGRLIRSRDDVGVVLLLDSRAVRRRYGEVFVDSLPPARVVTGPSEIVVAEMERFFRRVG